jgi:hypothetical protein
MKKIDKIEAFGYTIYKKVLEVRDEPFEQAVSDPTIGQLQLPSKPATSEHSESILHRKIRLLEGRARSRAQYYGPSNEDNIGRERVFLEIAESLQEILQLIKN